MDITNVPDEIANHSLYDIFAYADSLPTQTLKDCVELIDADPDTYRREVKLAVRTVLLTRGVQA